MARSMLTVAALVVCVALSTQKKLPGTRRECKSANTSIAVMVDVSSSMGPHRPQTAQVVQNIFKTFDEMKAEASSAGGSLDIAVSTFDKNVHPIRRFGSSVSFKDTENKLIHRVNSGGKGTELPKAMKQIETFMNEKQGGSFPAAILIADGGTTDAGGLATAQRLREQNVLLHTIYIGSTAATQETLAKLAYNKTMSHNVKDFTNAGSAINTLAVIFKEICEYVKEHTAPPPLRTTKRTTKKPTTTTTTTKPTTTTTTTTKKPTTTTTTTTPTTTATTTTTPEPTAQPAGDTPAAPEASAVPDNNSKPCCANANGGNLLLAVVMGSLPNGKPLSLKVSNGEKSLEILADGKNGTVRVAGTPELRMKP